MSPRRTIAALCLTLSLAACGGSDGGPSFEGEVDSFTDSLAAVDALTFAETSYGVVFGGQDIGTPFILAPGAQSVTPAQRAFMIIDRMKRLSGPGAAGRRPAPSARLQSAPMPSMMVCQPTESGVLIEGIPVDSDADGVPDDYTADYGTGCSTLESGFIYTLSGKYRLRDTGTGFASYEFTATKLKSKVRDGETGEYISDFLNSIETASFAAELATHEIDMALTFEDHFVDFDFKFTIALDESSTFDPDGGSSFTLGGTLPSGLLDFTAELQFLGSASVPGNYRFDLSTPTPMHFSTGCGSGITAGSLEGAMNGDPGVGFQWQWTACAAPTLSLFGYIGEP